MDGRSLLTKGRAAVCAALIGMLAAGCATAPPSQRGEGYSPARGEEAAATAVAMVGKPYRFRGETPSGFDCSGLVRYSYRRAGIDVPHGTTSLMRITSSVGRRNARLGDLLFFTQRGKKYSHVGIYIGNNAFVHAPSTGGFVRQDSMDDPYWQKHYLDTRRFF